MYRTILLHVSLLACLTSHALAQAPSAENVLVLVVDDLGIEKTGVYGFLGTSGDPLAPKTPNIDRLARNGLLFRNAWAAPGCSTTRAEALTGKYPNRTGIGNRIANNVPGAEGMRAEELTVADLLPPNYVAGVVGKWHLAGNGAFGSSTSGIDHAPRCGFDFHVGSAGNLGDDAIDYFDWTKILAFLANLALSQTVDVTGDYATSRTTTDTLRAIEAIGDRPFFLWVGYNAPHKPFHEPPAHLITSTDLDLNSDLGRVKATIEALDTEIGRLLSGIDPEVLARTTVIWFSDNGTHREVVEPPWEPNKVKGSVYNGGINVPFLVMSRRVPVEFRGTECDRLIDLTDLLPTIAEMLGVAIPVGLDGTSFLPYLVDPESPQRRPWIFSERFKPNFIPQPGMTIAQFPIAAHDQAVRGERYKLLRRRTYSGAGALTSERLELYDLELDYYELQNLLDLQGNSPPELQATVDGLLAVLDQMAS